MITLRLLTRMAQGREIAVTEVMPGFKTVTIIEDDEPHQKHIPERDFTVLSPERFYTKHIERLFLSNADIKQQQLDHLEELRERREQKKSQDPAR